MGYVFTPDELIDGKVPKKEDYPAVCAELRILMKDLHRRGIIQSALFFGSVADNEWKVGSDVDLLAAFSGERFPMVVSAVQSIDTRNVPVEVVPLNTDLSLMGWHDMPHHFVEYLEMTAQNGDFIGANPISFLSYPHGYPNYRQGIIGEAAYKAMKLPKMVLASKRYGREHAELLERLMRWPVYIARGALQYAFDCMPSEDGKPPKKALICDAYYEVFGEDSESSNVLRRSQELSAEYRDFVENPEDVLKYKVMLDKIESTTPDVQFFMGFHLNRYKRD
jgi:predicted nucleotidyltransferase